MKNILCLGDSLTNGYCHSENKFYPYADKLTELCKDVCIDYIALSGFTVDEIIKNLDEESVIDSFLKKSNGFRYQLSKKNYDICIILLGSNDVAEGDNPVVISEDILKIHSIIHNFNCKIVSLTIPKQLYEDYITREIRNKINVNLISYKSKFENNQYYVVDIDKIFGENYQHMDIDGFHLKKEGYHEIAGIIFKYLNMNNLIS